MKRNKKGQFVYINGKTRYKAVMYKGRRIDEHCRIMCIHLGIDRIPNGYIVHHKDGNKKNNIISNLEMITYKQHNNIHKHPAWNKGIKASENKSWAEAIKKAQAKRKLFFLPKFKETYELRMSGKTVKEISKIMGVCERQIHTRIQEFKDRLNYTGELN